MFKVGDHVIGRTKTIVDGRDISHKEGVVLDINAVNVHVHFKPLKISNIKDYNFTWFVGKRHIRKLQSKISYLDEVEI